MFVIVAEKYKFIVGVDTHARKHVTSVINNLGTVIARREFRVLAIDINKLTREPNFADCVEYAQGFLTRAAKRVIVMAINKDDKRMVMRILSHSDPDFNNRVRKRDPLGFYKDSDKSRADGE